MKKKHHILRNTIIIIVSILVIIFGGVGIVVTDFTDNTPDYITEVDGVDTGTYVGNKASAALENTGLLDDFEFLFNEREINDLLATIVPNIAIPMVKIKSIYLSIAEDDSITAEAPITALFYKSCAKIDGFLSYDRTTLKLTLSNIKVNLLSSTHGIVKAIMSEDTVKSIQTAVNDAGVSLTMAKDEDDIIVTMTNIDICKTIINCTNKSLVGFLISALTAGVLNAENVELVVNKSGKTGVIIHRSLL